MAMEIRAFAFLAAGSAAVLVAVAMAFAGPARREPAPLPEPLTKGKMSLEEALAGRRSIRSFKPDALSRRQIAQLCWAAQGISEPARGYRTCPSAGALYPLELYVVTAEGVDHYLPARHALVRHRDGDVRRELQGAALGQPFVGAAPATFVITAVAARTEGKYGRRAERYVLMEVGHAGQNLLLQAVALNLGAVPVGAFHDEQVAKALQLPKEHVPLYLIPVGSPAGK